MTVDMNRTVAIAMIEEFAATSSLDLSQFSEDATWWTFTTGELPIAVHSERNSRLAKSLFDGPSRLVIRSVTAEDERVAIETESSQPLKGGRSYDNRHFWLVSFRDGKMSGVRAYFDTAVVQQTFRIPGAKA